jgi:integrase
MGRALGEDVDEHAGDAPGHPDPVPQGGTLARRDTPRRLRAQPLDPRDLRRVGRNGRPYVHRRLHHAAEPSYGAPLSASAKAATIGALRVLFSDCQEWGWIERRFDPGRALLTPRAVRNSIGPNPRVIDDAVWAKLLWAGLNLAEADLPTTGRYPLELVRALALCWLFSGSRSNEIVRLRVGCVRWQARDGGEPVCLLDIPVTKTSTAFTRPVDPILGHALEEWERKRPVQPQLVDWRTGERVNLLFELRAK